VSATLAARHSVADYATWRKGYDAAEPIRQRHGCTGNQVLRLPEDHNDLFITHEFASVADANAFIADPEFAAAMKEAGVTSAPRIEIFESI
jgi:hypothetical protein